MRVIKPSTVRRFWIANPKAERELKKWLAVTDAADWRSPADVKAAFGARVDFVMVKSANTVTVFDIANNNWRLIAAIHYDHPRVFVLRILTHEEYDKKPVEANAMSRVAGQLPRSMPRTFDGLNALLPLRPISDKIELDNAYELVDRLAVINRPTKDQCDYLSSLVILTEAFEKEDNQAAMDQARKVTGLELLKYLLANTRMTQAQLAKLLGVGEGAASMILKGHRSITADHARVLGKHFKLEPGAFIR